MAASEFCIHHGTYACTMSHGEATVDHCHNWMTGCCLSDNNDAECRCECEQCARLRPRGDETP